MGKLFSKKLNIDLVINTLSKKVGFLKKFTLTFSASCLLIFEEAWNRINGFFFNDNKTEIIP